MDYFGWILLIVIVIFAISRMMPVKGVTQISAQDAKTMLKDKNIAFIDVRTPGEYQARHDKNFKNIPLANVMGRVNELSKDQPIVLICQSGMRSMQAAKILKKQGFTTIYNVQGGMNAW